MKPILKVLVRYALSTAIFFLILEIVAGMPFRWSLVLALLIALVARAFGDVAPKPQRRFTPYYVNLLPKWRAILTDYKILNGTEHWESIQEAWKSGPRPNHVFIRDGMWLNFVSSRRTSNAR